jgi:uncharacterized protein
VRKPRPDPTTDPPPAGRPVPRAAERPWSGFGRAAGARPRRLPGRQSRLAPPDEPVPVGEPLRVVSVGERVPVVGSSVGERVLVGEPLRVVSVGEPVPVVGSSRVVSARGPVAAPSRSRAARRAGRSLRADSAAGPRTLLVGLAALLLLGGLVAVRRGGPAVHSGATVFVAICVQAMPFLVLGVLVSGGIAAFAPARLLRKMLPRNETVAVGVAGLAGMALPGCECASVPIARRLMWQGVPPAAALAFLLAAPAVNPVVLVATAVAFPTAPAMVLARFLGSLLTACLMGWLWSRSGRTEWITRSAEPHGGTGWVRFVEAARTDLAAAGGFLVAGALAAATLNVLVPPAWFAAVGGNVVAGVAALAGLAVVLALCSEADAFVAAAMPLPLLARLVFLVVGPAVDVKLIALQAGAFGRAFVVRFAPVTFLVAVGSAVAVGLVVLGGHR